MLHVCNVRKLPSESFKFEIWAQLNYKRIIWLTCLVRTTTSRMYPLSRSPRTLMTVSGTASASIALRGVRPAASRVASPSETRNMRPAVNKVAKSGCTCAFALRERKCECRYAVRLVSRRQQQARINKFLSVWHTAKAFRLANSQ